MHVSEHLRCLGLSCGLALALTAPAAAQQAVSASVSNVRLALTQLAAGAGVEIDTELLGDTPGGGSAIYLNQGDVTLAMLDDLLADSGHPDALIRKDDRFVASMPIVVLKGASLSLSEGDRLDLSRREGSYLISFGALDVDHATIAAGSDVHPDIAGFRPFVAALGPQSLSLKDATLTGLGYGDRAYSAGLFLGGRGLLSFGSPAAMTGNSFTDLRGVVLQDLDGVNLTDTEIADARGSGLMLRDIDGGTITDLTVRDTGGEQALHLSGVSDMRLVNVALDGGQGKGMRVDDNSRALQLRDVAVRGFDGSGATMAQGATCVLFDRIEVSGNKGAGFAERGAGTTIFNESRFADNRGPGLMIDRQRPETRVLITESRFAGNRMGIRATGLADLRLHDNDFTDQRPRLLSGDLDALTPDFLRASADGGAGDLSVTGVRALDPAPLRRDAARAAFDTCSGEGAT
ncbi:right-handed parallel beta-helix repeat-containing protein [Thioclava nitratireducens]|uniref:right-handed parallel beta-helix repeat-containing protein n=1 Tax=Thioclava nitratireducens TaxID=1915078 RepID=UPI0024814C0E|nr:right-handed parallel beta-helix repeat-containing protein [Thioclava nitratireducens]WGT49796.1 right-handed parallel beta-helix repeat-containing protein [Thioclava nitratireducens]